MEDVLASYVFGKKATEVAHFVMRSRSRSREGEEEGNLERREREHGKKRVRKQKIYIFFLIKKVNRL
jgi:hypothetical protein